MTPKTTLQSMLLNFALLVSGIQTCSDAGTNQSCAYEIVQVPFIFKYAVDGLAASPTGDPLMSTSVLAMTPIALLIGYGIARVTAVGCNELRNAVFAKVWTFSLIGLMAFHLQTEWQRSQLEHLCWQSSRWGGLEHFVTRHHAYGMDMLSLLSGVERYIMTRCTHGRPAGCRRQLV